MSAPRIQRAQAARRRLATYALSMLPLLMLAACGEPAAVPDEAVTAKLPPAAASPQATALGPFPSPGLAEPEGDDNSAEESALAEAEAADPPTLSSSRYTSLDPSSCTPLEDGAADTAVRRRCAGPLDYALETSDSNRQNDLAIIAPGGRRAELNLAGLAANARLGKTAEWRRDASGRPRALIVRLDSAPDSGAKAKVSALVVTRLTPPSCVVAVIPRGPRQNEKARAIADSGRLECMNDVSSTPSQRGQ